MRPLDWVVLICTLSAIVLYGLYKGRGSKTVNQYLLAGKSMPWYAMGLSIMATQASAVTFIATTGQAYVDGMRFVQFYFGVPVAMVILSATAVPIFHRADVFTAYEYLERRFDAKTRALGSVIFLIQRGLGVGIALYAPALVLAVIFGWDDRVTALIMGLLVVVYTATGGIPAVTWTDVLQMSIIFCGLVMALISVFFLLPPGISVADAVYIAGAVGKLHAVVPHFDLNDRYTLWSGLIGGTFLSLAYFGCDQSQVQRYLTGKSIGQSKLSLLFNAMAKVPMQFFILFVGAMVFVFYLFEEPPMLFQKTAMQTIAAESASAEGQFGKAWEARRDAAWKLATARRAREAGARQSALDAYGRAQSDLMAARQKGIRLYEKAQGKPGFNDTNYVFLSFVTQHLPTGIVGLVIAVIFAAAMSASSGEVNSLATVTVIDIYKRHVRQKAPDRHYLLVSRLATVFWGMYAVAFAQYARNMGSLIEAVNMVGSLFYGTLLGVFTLAFFFKRVGGTAAFAGMLAGEAAILATARFTNISFLWYNVIGALVVIAVGNGMTMGKARTDFRPNPHAPLDVT
jgi:Na+/proline symporter